MIVNEEVREIAVQDLALQFLEKRNGKTFNVLYKRLKPGMVFYANKILKNMSSAEDVVSITFEKIWLKMDQYNPYWNFSTWAYRIVHNESMQSLRKSKSTTNFPGDIRDDDAPMYQHHISLEVEEKTAVHPDWYFDEVRGSDEIKYDLVIIEMYKLPENYRGIMIDREIHHMKYSDIAIKYHININSVKTRIKRARTIIQNKLKEMGVVN